MNSSFSALNQNQFSRKWAGTDGAVDPYISGYFFTRWEGLPGDLSSAILTGGSSHELSKSDLPNLLAGSCLAVTLPGGTVNKAEYTGLGGIRFSVPTNVEFDNTVTVKFLEFQTLPVFHLIHAWVRLIRDYSSGVSEALGKGRYTKSNYACNMYYWTTKPNGIDIEYAACITGMFPLKDPTDLLGADLTTYDKLEIDIDFNADYIWHEDWVYTKVSSLASQISTIDTYDQ